MLSTSIATAANAGARSIGSGRHEHDGVRIAAAHGFAEVSLGILVALAIVAVWREEQRLFDERTGG